MINCYESKLKKSTLASVWKCHPSETRKTSCPKESMVVPTSCRHFTRRNRARSSTSCMVRWPTKIRCSRWKPPWSVFQALAPVCKHGSKPNIQTQRKLATTRCKFLQERMIRKHPRSRTSTPEERKRSTSSDDSASANRVDIQRTAEVCNSSDTCSNMNTVLAYPRALILNPRERALWPVRGLTAEGAPEWYSSSSICEPATTFHCPLVARVTNLRYASRRRSRHVAQCSLQSRVRAHLHELQAYPPFRYIAYTHRQDMNHMRFAQ